MLSDKMSSNKMSTHISDEQTTGLLGSQLGNQLSSHSSANSNVLSNAPNVGSSSLLSNAPNVGSSSLLSNAASSLPSGVSSTNAPISLAHSDTKPITISMTRANKILAKMRSTDVAPPKRPCYDTKLNYGMKVKLLCFNRDAVETALEDMKKKVREKILKKSLVEKWKNRLFELNVRHGVNIILSEIDTLKYEVSTIKEILEECKTHSYASLEGVLAGMGDVANYEKRYDLEWNVTTFNANKLRERLAEIEKRLSELDDKKDKINIENTFSIHLTPEELKLLNL